VKDGALAAEASDDLRHVLAMLVQHHLDGQPQGPHIRRVVGPLQCLELGDDGVRRLDLAAPARVKPSAASTVCRRRRKPAARARSSASCLTRCSSSWLMPSWMPTVPRRQSRFTWALGDASSTKGSKARHRRQQLADQADLDEHRRRRPGERDRQGRSPASIAQDRAARRVVDLGLQAASDLAGADDAAFAPARIVDLHEQIGHRAGMAFAHPRRLARLGQALEREQAHRLEHPVARRFAGVDADQRLVDEAAEDVEQRPGVDRAVFAVRGDGLGQPQREAADEHAEPPKHRLLVRVEQRMAPFERGLQRLVARHRVARAAGEQAQALSEPLMQALHAQQLDARRRELDGQRQTVELAADRAYDGRGRRLESETAVDRTRPFDEQADCAEALVGDILRPGQRQRRQLEDLLVCRRSDSWLVTRRWTAGAARCRLRTKATAASSRCSQLSMRRSSERLATVAARRSVGGPAPSSVTPKERAAAMARAAGSCTAAASTQATPSLQRAARRVATASARRGLADAAGPGERDQAVRRHQAVERGQLGLAADQGRGRLGQGAFGGCRGRRRSRGGIILDRCHEPVAAPGHGGDRLRSEHLAQRAHVDVEVGLLDDHVGPDEVEQLVLRDRAIAPG
jgi:hypothetical protein